MTNNQVQNASVPPPLEKATRDKTLLKLLLAREVNVTQDELEYFRKHPDEIDEVTAPVNVHKLFLVFGTVLGILLVALSKGLKASTIISSPALQEFLVDIVFEVGVALIGAGVTAYLLGILLGVQQENAKRWRKEIRRQIRSLDRDSTQ